MATDPRYIALYEIQQYLVDKDTGLPLANGYLFFWQDNSRTVPKTVYERTGSPPNYTYTALPNPVRTSIVGTPINGSGDDVVIFAFPFDENDDIELYFLSVFADSGVPNVPGVPQFTREGLPNGVTGVTPGGTILGTQNLLINGTFYNNQPTANPITTTTTVLAEGPHERLVFPDIVLFKNNTAALDRIQFLQFAPGDNPLTGDITPQYYLNYTCTNTPAGETVKEVEFPLASSTRDLEGITLTVSLWAMSPLSNSLDIVFNQYFGDGGAPSAPVALLLGTIPLTSQWTHYTFSFTVPSTAGKTLGTCGNNYSYISCGLQRGVVNNTSFTNALTMAGVFTDSPAYPYQTEQQVLGYLGSPRSGDLKVSMRATEIGWLPMNDGTIGSATSGATTRANIDTFPLFYYIYTNTVNADAPVSGGRTTDAFTDFALNKTISLTLQQNRALAGSSGTNANGHSAGTATNVASITISSAANLPAHTHASPYPGYTATNDFSLYDLGVTNTLGQFVPGVAPTTGSTGSSTPFNSAAFSIVSPTTYRNIYIRL